MMRIGIVGTGAVGRTLGTIWARAGHEVAFGSRDPARAAEAVTGLAAAHATTQEGAAAFGDVVLWTPRGVMPADPNLLAGKIVIDPNNREPGPDGNYASPRPEGPSLAEQLQAAAPRARVVKAFNTVVMRILSENPERLRASGAQVFLAGDDAEAKRVAAALAAEAGLGAVDLGGLEAAWLAETMADTFRQAMKTSPAGCRQAVAFADLTGRQGEMDRVAPASLDHVIWPEQFHPNVSSIYGLNDVDVEAPPHVVWKLLVDAENWHRYFPPENHVRILGGARELALGTKLTRVTAGHPMSLEVTECVPGKRLAWSTTVDGDHTGSTAYHGWVITPTERGCHVLTEETQQGRFFLEMIGRDNPGLLYRYHQEWVEALADAATLLVKGKNDQS